MNTDLISRADAEALFRNARGELHKSAIRNEQNGHPIKDLPTRDLMLLNAEQMIHLLPFVNPQPCEDAISRQAAIQAIYNNINRLNMAKAVRDLPPVQPIRPLGHWIECEDEVKCFCSECKEKSDYPTNYCQNCGANMQESEEQA